MTTAKAKAPRPVKGGRDKAQAEVDIARRVTEFSIRGEVVGRLAVGNVPLDEKFEVRRQVRLPWHEVLGEGGVPMDIASAAILCWLARRASGEPDLLWSTHQATWDDTVRIDEIGLDTVDPDEAAGDDPQS